MGSPVICNAIRPLGHFVEDIWGTRFDNFTSDQITLLEKYSKEVELLKKEVQDMLMDKSITTEKQLNLIDAVQRLGVLHYYESEIKELLDNILETFAGRDFKLEYDLHDTALIFRLFRLHGYRLPCDVFLKFVDGEGKFKECLQTDVKGMLSLHEALPLRINGECILDEALAFTTNFLQSIATSSEQARKALRQPMHHNLARVECRRFISMYAKEKSRDETLLRLAKVEFNRLQLLHLQELSLFQKWYRSFDFPTKLPFIRARSVEIHFWALNMLFEPRYSLARSTVAKIVHLMTTLDDSYDAYGLYEELQQLTDAFERWDSSAIEHFPADYMKSLYEFVICTYDELAKEFTDKGKPYAAPFLKEYILETVKAYFVEASWLKDKYVPTFEEYMANAKATGGVQFLITSCLIGMEEIGLKPLEQIKQAPKVIISVNNISRLTNDIVGHEEEKERGDAPSGIECYMNDNNGMNRAQVVEKIREMIDDAWKNLNENLLISRDQGDEGHLPKLVLKPILNYARVMMTTYKVIDGFNYPEKCLKEDILDTYAHPFSI